MAEFANTDRRHGQVRADSAILAPVVHDASLSGSFRELTRAWREDTGHLSSPSQIALHPAYQRIIGMGDAALPLIFEDLQEHDGQWYVALRAITEASPVPPEASGRAGLVREAWLR